MHLTQYFNGCRIRIEVDSENLVWFLANDVCKALDYSTHHAAIIRQHCKSAGIRHEISSSRDGSQTLTYISETNLYLLLAKVNKPNAKSFETWVLSSALPEVRQAIQTERDLRSAPGPAKPEPLSVHEVVGQLLKMEALIKETRESLQATAESRLQSLRQALLDLTA